MYLHVGSFAVLDCQDCHAPCFKLPAGPWEQYSAMGRRRAAAHGDSRPPATGDTGTGGSATGDKVEDVKSATRGNGKCRSAMYPQCAAMGRRHMSAAGDSRLPPAGDTGKGGSGTSDKVEDVESANGNTNQSGSDVQDVWVASGGKTKQIQAFGCRIRCHIEREAELRKCIKEERSRKSTWTHLQWKIAMAAISEHRWGVGPHGGHHRKTDASYADAESPFGGDDSTTESGKQQLGSKRIRLSTGSSIAHVPPPASGSVTIVTPPLCAGSAALAIGSASLSLAPGSASGSIRLCSGVTMGYKIIGPPLGKGTFGTTYHALWKNGNTDAGGQHVVVKHIPLARPENGPLNYEAREVEILSSLHHKNVVKLLFAVQTAFALDLLLEVCDADLRSVLRHGMSEVEGKDAIRQICHGLEYVHARYVVHRDLKPANILLQKMRDHSIYKLGDFGSARQLLHCKVVAAGTEESQMPMTMAAGKEESEMPMTLQITTLWYRAPEILLRCRDYSLPVDMWAFGCICMEILSNKVAFQGTSDMHMVSLIFGKFGLPSPTRWQDLYKSTRPNLLERLNAEMLASGGTAWTLGGMAREFVGQLILPSPSQRLTAATAKRHSFIAA